LAKKKAADRKRQQRAERKRKAAAKKQRLAKQRQQELLKKKRQQQRLAKERKRKLEAKQRREAELKAQLAAEARRKLAQRRQVQGAAASALSRLTAAIKQKVENNWVRPVRSKEGISAEVQLHVGAGGIVLSVKIINSSGDSLFDRSIEAAVKKASPLPFPSDPRYLEFISTFNARFR